MVFALMNQRYTGASQTSQTNVIFLINPNRHFFKNKGYHFVPLISLSKDCWAICVYYLPLCATDEKVKTSVVFNKQLVITAAYSVANKGPLSVT